MVNLMLTMNKLKQTPKTIDVVINKNKKRGLNGPLLYFLNNLPIAFNMQCLIFNFSSLLIINLTSSYYHKRKFSLILAGHFVYKNKLYHNPHLPIISYFFIIFQLHKNRILSLSKQV